MKAAATRAKGKKNPRPNPAKTKIGESKHALNDIPKVKTAAGSKPKSGGDPFKKGKTPKPKKK